MMTKTAINSLLLEKHNQFLSAFTSLSESDFSTSRHGKWSPAQQLDHIIRAVEPVVLAFSLPHFVPRFLFGKANRPSRSYEALVEKYKAKLAAGGRASGRFIPKGIEFHNRQKALDKVKNLTQKLVSKTNRYTEQDLDLLLLPHPLLGKLTLREMLYFTAYHADHHRQHTLQNLIV